jgi:sugar lactone lactonase YvrE
LNRFGGEGDNPGQFHAPEDIVVDGQGRVYVSDIKGVQIFNRDGRYLGMIKVDGAAFGMAVDNQDNLYVITNHPTVYKFKVTVKP